MLRPRMGSWSYSVLQLNDTGLYVNSWTSYINLDWHYNLATYVCKKWYLFVITYLLIPMWPLGTTAGSRVALGHAYWISSSTFSTCWLVANMKMLIFSGNYRNLIACTTRSSQWMVSAPNLNLVDGDDLSSSKRKCMPIGYSQTRLKYKFAAAKLIDDCCSLWSINDLCTLWSSNKIVKLFTY